MPANVVRRVIAQSGIRQRPRHIGPVRPVEILINTVPMNVEVGCRPHSDLDFLLKIMNKNSAVTHRLSVAPMMDWTER